MKNNILFEPYQGFIRGNMFKNIYDNYEKVYDIKPLNEQAELLTYIDILTFAYTDIQLYLDVHPNDEEMIKTYNEYSDNLKKTILNYEKKYGPINSNSQEMDNFPWPWVMEPFPWEE